ncbi:hypothetical protein ACFFSY_33635 [Paenibacillus aurantiacus]|uniref:Spi protease inhibitor domain-containing protein n=1 Tax=Paenibacillus aurantiacus TaxID=1936118 RepID=A0ABV5L272_9BACL
MMKIKVSQGAALLVLATFLVSSNAAVAGAVEDASVSRVSKIVSVAEAKKVAEQFIKGSNFAEKWYQTQLTFSEVLYDIDESQLGYYFIVRNEGEAIGHIIVSSSTDKGPVLEYGDGMAETNKLKLKSYYNHGLIRAQNASAVKEKAEAKNINLKPMASNPDISNTDWARLNSNVVALANPISKEISVTHISQRATGVTNQDSACGPATGAMTANYLAANGHQVRGGAYYGGNAQLVNHLYSEMGTTIAGTSLAKYSEGLLTHLRHNGEKWVGTEHRGTDNVAWGTYTSAINSSLPVGIRFDYFVSGNTYRDYHFVLGVGYVMYTQNYFGIKDPDESSATTYLLWSDNDQDIGFLNLFKQS